MRGNQSRNPNPETKVVWDVTTSLDGFIADPKDNPGRIFDWFFTGAKESKYGGPYLPFKLSPDDARYFDSWVGRLGAIVSGRRTYDVSKAWGGSFFVPVPFFVLTHNPPRRVPKGTTTFTFVTDGIRSAIRLASEAAGPRKAVSIMGANTAKQCIEARLLDEIYVHISPFLLGDGVRLFEHKRAQFVELERTKVIKSSSGTTHIHYNVVK